MTDISNFHLINDYWGYETGTKLLNYVLRRMELFQDSTFVNRYHSDIFVAIIDITGRKNAEIKKRIEQYNKQITAEVLKETSAPSEEIISHTNIVREKAKK